MCSVPRLASLDGNRWADAGDAATIGSMRPNFRWCAPALAGGVLLAACGVLAADAPMPPGLEMLRRTERAFSQTTSEIGVRNGFLTFFAADAIAPPDTGSIFRRMASNPSAVDPRPPGFTWEPLFGDIAKDGDLGYLTGPVLFTRPDGSKSHGVYFSIWRKNPEGLWRVMLDAGVDVPSLPAEFASNTFRPAAASAWKAPDGAKPDREGLARADRELLAAAEKNPSAAYGSALAEQARMHRDGRHPVLGREAFLAELERSHESLSGRQLKVDVAASGDLGWTFGTCRIRTGDTTKDGGYTRVWKRDDAGRWRVVLDVVNPVRN